MQVGMEVETQFTTDCWQRGVGTTIYYIIIVGYTWLYMHELQNRLYLKD
jgi:hypothetical protein